MSAWKAWMVSVSAAVVIGGGALTVAVWNNLSSEWTVEAAAAQFALDHSPLMNITAHDVFTGSGAQEVFQGTDVFGREWYAFVFGSPFQVEFVQSRGILTKDQMLAAIHKQHMTPLKEQIGYLSPAGQSTFNTQADVIWEVYAKDQTGHPVYTYYDAKSGDQLRLP